MEHTLSPFGLQLQAILPKDTCQPKEDEYLGPDGLRYCKNCRTARQCLPPGLPPMPVLCRCRAIEKEREQRREDERRRSWRVHKLQKACFDNRDMLHWTFDADTRPETVTTRYFRKYAEEFADFQKRGHGLIVCGEAGSGKSYLAAAVANQLLQQGVTVRMTNLHRIVLDMQAAGFAEKRDIFQRLVDCDLLILDDFDLDHCSAFTMEQAFALVNNRYEARRPTIVTTGYTQEKLNNLYDAGAKRIYSRLERRGTRMRVLKSGSA